MPSNNKRIAVYAPDLISPIRHLKYRDAKGLVDRGRAEFIDPLSIRLIEPNVVATSSSLINGNKQGAVYELAAIDKNPQYFDGGLTRTEHQPAKFSPWKGARIGHQ
jgi:hypothetical protein